jgi:hypothetical protein
LEDPANVALKLLVWMANTAVRTKLPTPLEWVQIVVRKTKGAPEQHKTGTKRVVIRRINDLDSD